MGGGLVYYRVVLVCAFERTLLPHPLFVYCLYTPLVLVYMPPVLSRWFKVSMAMTVQDLPGDQDLRSDGAFTFRVEAAIKSSRGQRGDKGSFKIFVSAILPCAHIYPLPVALFPAALY